jgi:hypothetical protein
VVRFEVGKMSSQKRKLASTTIGYRGVQKSGKRFMSSIFVGRKLKYLGTYDNAKEAALAFDHAATQQKLPSSKLNYPNGLPIDDEDYDKIMNPIKKKKLQARNTTGYRGVHKSGKSKFVAQMAVARKHRHLGTFDTAKEAALAFDHAIILHKLPFSRLNFPNGQLPSDDEDYAKIMTPTVQMKIKRKKGRLSSNNTLGYRGVFKNRDRFQSRIQLGGKRKSLGTYGTVKEAALAFDQAIRHYKLPLSRLNFPGGVPIDDEDYDALMDPKKKRILSTRNTTGYNGVHTTGGKKTKKFRAAITVHGSSTKHLGTFDDIKEAALAFDQAVVQYNLPSSRLNFPNNYIDYCQKNNLDDLFTTVLPPKKMVHVPTTTAATRIHR